MIYRCILPNWTAEKFPQLPRVQEGEFDWETIQKLNKQFYNIYFLPNYPSEYTPGTNVSGSQVDTFSWVFLDMDLKEGKWESKDAFINFLKQFSLPPTLVVDSGNGIHAYWLVSDLTPISYLHFQRRLIRFFKTDDSLSTIYQLMRVAETLNTKDPSNLKPCTLIAENDFIYTAEQLSQALPIISHDDEQKCQRHFDQTYNPEAKNIKVDDHMPVKFFELVRTNKEVKEIWAGDSSDRSKDDYRLGHIMFASNFSKDEARSVLVNTAKALERGPAHRLSYAENIVDKIWSHELESKEKELTLHKSVKEILETPLDAVKGARFSCWPWVDDTLHGFRLGQVIGLVAGSGVGKTAMALNLFEGFVAQNPSYDHFFIPLEQPADEIAQRWKSMCGEHLDRHDKVQIISNYGDDGTFRHLSFTDIKEYILKYQKVRGRKVGCVVIDHIGALKKKGANGENQDLMDICHAMKSFAVETNTMLVMQSQTPREKAGIGDLELDKDAAYGTVYFESYCDYLITLWQPLKRCYSNPACPVVTAFKFCKIRHKKQGSDKLQEDTPYLLFFDPTTERLRELTQTEEKKVDFFQKQAVAKRKQDRKTDLVTYTTIRAVKESRETSERKTNHSTN